MAHGTNCPFLHIIIHIIIIFLFQPASTNLIAYFPIKNLWAYTFYITGQLFHVLKFRFITHLQVTATSFVISVHIDDHKAKKGDKFNLITLAYVVALVHYS